MVTLGFTGLLFVKEDETYGADTSMESGVSALPVRPGYSFTTERSRIRSEHLAGQHSFVENTDDAVALESWTGQFQCLIPWKSSAFKLLLKNLMGKVTTTGPVGAKYTHTFDWNNYVFPGLSVAVADADGKRVYHGGQVVSIKINATVGAGVVCDVNMVGSWREHELITQPTYTPLTAAPFMLASHCSAELDTVALPLTSIDFTMAREVLTAEEQSYVLGSNRRSLLVPSGGSITGTVRRHKAYDGSAGEVTQLTELADAGTTAVVEFIGNHPSDADFTCNYQFTVKFIPADPNPSDRGVEMEEITFEAFDMDDATDGVFHTDEDADPATATGSYDGS